MSQQAARGAAVIGGLLIAVGLFLGLAGITSGGYDCGSAFRGGFAQDIGASLSGHPSGLVGDCHDARSSRKTLALALLIPGALLALGGGAFALPTTTAPTEPQRTRTSSPSAR